MKVVGVCAVCAVLDEGSIFVGELEVRPHQRAVVANGTDVPLSPAEFGIVMMLAEHPGWVFSAEQLCQGPDCTDYSPESVSVLVSRLRRRFAEAGLHDVVETVRGFGYRIQPDPRGEDAAEFARAAGSRELRDALWRLQEAVIEAEHAGTPEQRAAATSALERARHAIFAALAK